MFCMCACSNSDSWLEHRQNAFFVRAQCDMCSSAAMSSRWTSSAVIDGRIGVVKGPAGDCDHWSGSRQLAALFCSPAVYCETPAGLLYLFTTASLSYCRLAKCGEKYMQLFSLVRHCQLTSIGRCNSERKCWDRKRCRCCRQSASSGQQQLPLPTGFGAERRAGLCALRCWRALCLCQR